MSQKAVVTTVREDLEEALRNVEAAEQQLQTALAEIRVAPRAEKTAVSEAIEQALAKLGAARGKVTAAEEAAAHLQAVLAPTASA